MIIRSQDKKTITNFNNVKEIYVRADMAIGAFLGNGYSEVIGTYSTEEKAVRVLDMICTEYQYAEECKHIGVGYATPEFVFQMPSDEEVEV